MKTRGLQKGRWRQPGQRGVGIRWWMWQKVNLMLTLVPNVVMVPAPCWSFTHGCWERGGGGEGMHWREQIPAQHESFLSRPSLCGSPASSRTKHLLWKHQCLQFQIPKGQILYSLLGVPINTWQTSWLDYAQGWSCGKCRVFNPGHCPPCNKCQHYLSVVCVLT